MDKAAREMILDTLAKSYADDRLEPIHIDCLVDAKAFHWPRCPKGRCGEHRDFLNTVVENPEIERIRAETRQALDKAKRHNQDTTKFYVIGCFCKHGINRSVAVARLVREVFVHLGYDPYEPHPMTPFHKWKNICSRCSKCPPEDTRKNSLFQTALDLWTAAK